MGEKYKPEQDDEVEVVLRGRVAFAYTKYPGFQLAGHIIHTERDEVVSVKKVAPPLPTTHGSVVRMSLGGRKDMRLLLTRDGYWVDERGDTLRPPFKVDEVIFDAGAEGD